jgi:hypothetical protein
MKLESAQDCLLMMCPIYGMILPILTLEAEEFDLVLPVRRRRLYLAEKLAMLLLVITVVLPVNAAVLAVAAVQDDLQDALRFCAALSLCSISMPFIAAPLMRPVRRMSPLLAMPIPVFVFFGAVTFTLAVRIPLLWMAAVAVPAAALAWFLGGRQFERYELAPSGDAGPARVTVTRSGFMDRFSPMARMLVHAVWLRWQFGLLLVGFGIISSLLIRNLTFVWFFAVFGNSIIMCLSGNCGELLPFVSRRAILRSVLGPVVATEMLCGGFWAISSGSALMVMWGLALALATVGMIWLILPSKREYRLPFLLRARRNLWWIIWICIAACTFIPGPREFFRRPHWEAMLRPTPLVGGNPVLVSCVIALATALLWWRCERKFREFEPFAFPAGYSRTA